MESLNKRFSDMHEKITLLEEMMRKIFTGWVCEKLKKVFFFKRKGSSSLSWIL
jgi:hypothetical protein